MKFSESAYLRREQFMNQGSAAGRDKPGFLPVTAPTPVMKDPFLKLKMLSTEFGK